MAPEIQGHHFLVLALEGQDAGIVGLVCEQAGFAWASCEDPARLCGELGAETLGLVATEESLERCIEELAACLEAQPTWSDLPVIVLTLSHERGQLEERWRFFSPAGNVSLLERPLRVETLRAALVVAHRARMRQYVMREQLEDLASAAQLLDERVRERTAELEQAIAQRDEAEKALVQSQRLEAVGQLTGGVAHDFNNLLQVIISSVALLERLGGQAELRAKAAETIRRTAQRGAQLTQQLLAFASRQALRTTRVDLPELLEAMRPLLERSLRGDVTLRLDLAPDLWPVKTDPTQLEVALLNLAINSRDAMPTGGALRISAFNERRAQTDDTQESQALPSAHVCLEVSDTGHGMTEDVAARIFEPFFSTKGPGQGTGLGLSQVYGFARQTGGKAELRATSPHGTTLALLLPRCEDADVDELPQTRLPPPALAELPSGLRILVVEDDEDVAQSTCDLLRELDCVPSWSPSGDDAVTRDLHGVDLVLSDVLMPGALDGLALGKALRRQRPQLPVLLISGYAGAPERVVDADFALLRKPFDKRQLGEALTAALEDSRSRR